MTNRESILQRVTDMSPQERRDAIDLLVKPSRQQLESCATNAQRTAALERLDTNRAFFEGLDDAGLALRVAALQTAGSNVRCACDGGACSCKPYARHDGVDPVEAARQKRDDERRRAGLSPTEICADDRRQAARQDANFDPVEAARVRRDSERRQVARQEAGVDPVEAARVRRDAERRGQRKP